MDRGNHYETAFEAYLRDRRLGYVAVDESRRSSLEDEPVKSIDFIVYGAGGAKLLVDIKGRKFPSQSKGKPRRVWQNWVERDDVEGLERWQSSFGPEYQALLVFAYYILPEVELRRGTADVWVWRGRRYLMRAVPVDRLPPPHAASGRRSGRPSTCQWPTFATSSGRCGRSRTRTR